MESETDKRDLTRVCAARAGDREAIEQLLLQNWDWLKALVIGILRGAGDADDVLQEIAIRVINKIDQLREPHCFRAWLASLARREAVKWRQQRSKQQTLPIEDLCLPAKEEDGVQRAEQGEAVDEVLRAAHALPEKYREVFFLQHGGNLSYKAMAAILEVPLTTIQIRLVRARRMILDRITERNEVQRT